jgi:processive 1,2-diacylglycerol beta-glucosyltransferase
MKKNNKKILIVSMSAGAGHLIAGKALEAEAKKSFRDFDVAYMDLTDFVSIPVKAILTNSYELMAKKIPDLWGLFYSRTDNSKIPELLHQTLKLSQSFSASHFLETVKNFNPDYIICTHFMPVYFLNHAPKKYKPNCPIGMIITDYELHNLWLAADVDHYFVATQKMQWKAKQTKPNTKVTASGIPIRPVFFEKKNISSLKKKYETNNLNKTILVLAGGHGLTKIDKIVKLLNKSTQKLNIIAIAGNNLKLKKSLEKIKANAGKKIKIIGWTNDIDELIKISDLVITKPGGLSVTECATLGKPMLAINPIPGQEEKNIHFILENNIGRLVDTPEDLEYYIENKVNFNKLPIKNASKIILEQIKKDI